jgi:hypothetical protein
MPIMNPVHFHMLMNHIPTVGFGLAFGVFLAGVIWKHEYLTRVGLVLVFLVALASIPTYLSGSAAMQQLEEHPEISQDMIQAHEDAVIPAWCFMMFAGFAAWMGLWQFRITRRLPMWNLATVALLGIIAFGLMARAADTGGEIRHPEIVQGKIQTDIQHGPTQWVVSLVADNTWVRPAAEVLHFAGMSLLFTVVLLVDLRMLGMAKSWSFSSLYQLLPLGILGFGVNWVTGMIFFLATPDDFMHNSTLFWKIGLILLGGLNALYFVLFDEPWKVEANVDAPVMIKAVALSAIVFWVVVAYLGMMLPFLGHAF